MEKVSLIARAFEKVGNRVGENQRIFIEEVIGTSLIAPLVIVTSFGPKTEKAKHEKQYQALRQPVSGLLKIAVSYALTIPLGRKIVNSALAGKLHESMNSSLLLNVDKIGNIQQLFQKLGTDKISENTEKKLKKVFNISLNQIENEQKFKELSTLKKTKFADNKLVSNYLTKVIQNMKGNDLILKEKGSKLLRTLLCTDYFSKNQLKILNTFIVKKHTKSFLAYTQVYQWIVSTLLFPVSAYLLNVIYPPFVKLVAPRLDMFVRGENKLK